MFDEVYSLAEHQCGPGVDFFLSHITDNNGNNLLMTLCAKSDPRTQFSKKQDSKLNLAESFVQSPVVKINQTNKQGDTALTLACAAKNTPAVKALLNHPDLDLDIENNKGETALSIVCRENFAPGLMLMHKKRGY